MRNLRDKATRFTIIAALAATLFFFSGLKTDAQSPSEPPCVEGELIIRLSPDGSTKALSDDFAGFQLQPKKLLSRRMNIWLFEYRPTGLRAADHTAILDHVRGHRDVGIAQFNHHVSLRSIYPNDPRFNEQWNMHNTGQTGGLVDADIDGPEAWDGTIGGVTALGDEIVVAVIDAGFDLDHEDLDFFKNTHEIPGNGLDDDSNGYVDDYDGWNAFNSSGSIPSSSHGTHVTGIVGAIGNNAAGVVGVNWNIKVLPIAVFYAIESDVLEAYGYALEMRARYNETDGAGGAFIVATNSSFGVDYGRPVDFPIWCAMYDSLGAAGILSAAATANLDIDVDVEGDVPTACPSDFLLSVTNTTDEDAKHSAAAYGVTSIDLGAPGTMILSTTARNSYGFMTGTSMATPHAAGAVALMYAAACSSLVKQYRQEPDSVALIIKQYLMDGADPIASLQGITVSGGRLNVHNSLQLLLNHPCGVSIIHTPLEDTRDTLNDYEVTCEITSDTRLAAESLLLFYEVASVWFSDTLEATGQPDEYHGFIPAQSPGTQINYYLLAVDEEGKADTTERFTFNVLDYAVNLSRTVDRGLGAPNDTVWYLFTVTNVGVYADDYDLTVSGNSWSTTLWDVSQTSPVSSSGTVLRD
ncbi:MAG: S8 family serine peptidase, partial [Candidatus Zixiibacteriota bacterium]